jgi:serine protease Do
MNNWKKLSMLTVAVAIIGISATAQTNNNTNKNNDKTQEIIIRKKGDKGEKMTIVVDGDKVTINGKPVDEFKNQDVTVLRRNGLSGTYGPRAVTIPRGTFEWNDGEGAFGPARSNRAMLGVVTDKGDGGAKVADITKESAAAKAGLQKDDVITKVDTKKIEDPEDLIAAIRSYKPNDKVDITYKRNGKENKTTATLGENKTGAYSFNFNNPDFNFDLPKTPNAPQGFTFNMARRPKIGLQIQDLEEGKGVKVKDVDDDSPASKAGLKDGDVITQINGKEVAGVDEVRNAIKDLKEGDSVKFTYKRGSKTETSEIKIPKRIRTADL